MAKYPPNPLTQEVRNLLRVNLCNYCTRVYSNKNKDGIHRLKFFDIRRGIPESLINKHLESKGWKVVCQTHSQTPEYYGVVRSYTIYAKEPK